MRLCSTCAEDVVWPFPQLPYSWSSLLDQLRGHVCGRDRGLTITLRGPRGAEFEDQWISEADEACLHALFESDETGLSAVERYIQGLTDRNPLVEAGKTPLLYPRPRRTGG